MKVQVNISKIKTVNELDFYWTNEDYASLLRELDFDDTASSSPAELLELLYMALSDLDPDEAAHTLLTYKLSDKLNSGQIQSLSHEMIDDKVAEEYPDPALHFDLFNINQLLYKAFGGTFPNTEASVIDMTVKLLDHQNTPVDKEVLIKALSAGLKDNNLINRLFEEQVMGQEVFSDAAKAIWTFSKSGDSNYQLITSKYWVDKEDVAQTEYDTEVVFFTDKH